MLNKIKFSTLAVALLLAACVPTQMPPSVSGSSASETAAAVSKGSRYTATVTAVSDGDTVRVRDRHGHTHKIRLAFIDAPETKQKHGLNSRDALLRLADGQNIEVEVVDIDRYRREVARLRVDGRDLNYSQVENGHAWHYASLAKRNQEPSDFARYQAAEQNARQQRSGLWQHPRPLAPWDYRKQQRARSAEKTAESEE